MTPRILRRTDDDSKNGRRGAAQFVNQSRCLSAIVRCPESEVVRLSGRSRECRKQGRRGRWRRSRRGDRPTQLRTLHWLHKFESMWGRQSCRQACSLAGFLRTGIRRAGWRACRQDCRPHAAAISSPGEKLALAGREERQEKPLFRTLYTTGCEEVVTARGLACLAMQSSLPSPSSRER